ncbi:MAG: transporter associated domain-containing protein [Anaerolineae bacterium]|nr:transporter associated domain-containing protein [Anaerolineae bacterium]MDK1119134.1 transporter associated domain-containing protein [Anaerolineae bacterium]
MIPIEWGISLSILILILNLLIAATRASLLNLRPLRLVALRDQYPEAVNRTLALIDDPRLRPSLRFGQTALRISLAAIILDMVVQAQGQVQSTLPILPVVILFLALSLMAIEFVVEGHILREPEHWGIRLGIFARALVIVLSPFVILPMRLLRSHWPNRVAVHMTEAELKTWIESEQEEGGLEREERRMISSILEFGDTLTREIMVPRVDINAFEIKTSLKQAAKEFTKSGHSRVPVYENEIDNIIGLLYAKDLLHIVQNGPKKVGMRDLLRPVNFVPDIKKVNVLLTEMQAQRIHMGIVVDEYGGVAGLVTLEDIIEEIIGEIQDEYDSSEEELVQQNGDEYIFLGRIDLDEFNQIMGSKLPKIESDTLGGFLFDQFGRVPQDNETIQTDGLRLTIDQVIGRRIRRVRAQRIKNDQEESIQEDDSSPEK